MRFIGYTWIYTKRSLIPKDYYKPKIEIRNYYLKWDDESYGMQTDLISEAEAIRRSHGKVVVKGLIIGVSSVVQVVKESEFGCASCGQSYTE